MVAALRVFIGAIIFNTKATRYLLLLSYGQNMMYISSVNSLATDYHISSHIKWLGLNEFVLKFVLQQACI